MSVSIYNRLGATYIHVTDEDDMVRVLVCEQLNALITNMSRVLEVQLRRGRVVANDHDAKDWYGSAMVDEHTPHRALRDLAEQMHLEVRCSDGSLGRPTKMDYVNCINASIMRGPDIESDEEFVALDD